MKIKFTYIILVVIAVFSLLFILKTKYSPLEHLKCISSAGKYGWRGYPYPTPSNFAEFMCIHYYSDAGKKCFSNEECQGKCLVTKDTVVEKSKGLRLDSKVVGGFGACEESDAPKSSYPGDFEHPDGWVI